jgi:hypothetical protein
MNNAKRRKRAALFIVSEVGSSVILCGGSNDCLVTWSGHFGQGRGWGLAGDLRLEKDDEYLCLWQLSRFTILLCSTEI